MRILLSGSSGFIGSALVRFFSSHEVVPLVRRKSPFSAAVLWDPLTGRLQKDDFEHFDVVIHLAGGNIAEGLWTKKKKKALWTSRCRDSWLLSQVLTRLNAPPPLVICASAIGFYGDRGLGHLTEESAPGKGFLPDLCSTLESSMDAIRHRGSRVVHMRLGIVLGKEGGFVKRMLPLCRLGLGGALGSGEQIMSWIALEDVIGAIAHIMKTPSLEGPVNLVAPHPVSQKKVMEVMNRQVGRGMGLPVPRWLLKLVLGEKAEALVLSSAYVQPQKLLESGYKFQCSTIDKWKVNG